MSAPHRDLISKRLRSLFADHLTSACALREIERDFQEADMAYRPDKAFQGGQRRSMIAGYHNALDFSDPADARKFLDVLALVLAEADRRWKTEMRLQRPPWSKPQPEPEHPLASLLGELGRCGYEWRNGAVVAASPSARLADTKTYAEKLDLGHLSEHIQRIEKSLDVDPRQAIGSAKELVETVAKTILTKRNVPYERSDDLLELGRTLFKVLKQLPDDVPDTAKGAATIKRTLSNLASLVQGVAELRGHYGTGHGQEGRAKGLRARHAKLAVGAAATLAAYWIETDRDMP